MPLLPVANIAPLTVKTLRYASIAAFLHLSLTYTYSHTISIRSGLISKLFLRRWLVAAASRMVRPTGTPTTLGERIHTLTVRTDAVAGPGEHNCGSKQRARPGLALTLCGSAWAGIPQSSTGISSTGTSRCGPPQATCPGGGWSALCLAVCGSPISARAGSPRRHPGRRECAHHWRRHLQ